jgi:hypothetical protein
MITQSNPYILSWSAVTCMIKSYYSNTLFSIGYIMNIVHNSIIIITIIEFYYY